MGSREHEAIAFRCLPMKIRSLLPRPVTLIPERREHVALARLNVGEIQLEISGLLSEYLVIETRPPGPIRTIEAVG